MSGASCPIVVAISGASGAAYAERLLGALLDADRDVTLLVTDPARLVIEHELGVEVPGAGAGGQRQAVEAWLGVADHPGRLRVADVRDLMDAICSGTHRSAAMVVIPCSMATLSGIATGRADDLVLRAADVMLKERRPLILVPRETPLSLIHLRNMTAVAQAGGLILPAMPGFYHDPKTIDDLVDHVVGKVLDQLGVDHGLTRRWGD